MAAMNSLLAAAVASGSTPAWVELTAAVQTVYQRGVPHTDRHGRPLRAPGPDSFLPLVLYDPQLPCAANATPTAKGQRCLPAGATGAVYTDANYTAVLPYAAFGMSEYVAAFSELGLQVIREFPTDAEVAEFKDSPALLGWYLREEPTGSDWSKNMTAEFEAYVEQVARIKAVDPVHPCFVLDCPWITPPATDWWVRWNSYGDISSHDNYPFDYRSTSLATINGDGGGIPQTVSLAVSANNASKPVWLCVQAFESGSWLMPSAREMRGQVYTGLIHGATGIIYFAMDSFVTRAGGVVGMAPRGLGDATYEDASSTDAHTRASASLLGMGANLWDAVAALNTELLELAPALFSPSATAAYSVAFAGSNATATPVRTLRKATPGGDVVLAVNVDNTRLSARFDLGASAAGVASVQVVFEGRSIALNGTAFVDTFEPMDVHVYRLVPS